jgi:hypothetical protein
LLPEDLTSLRSYFRHDDGDLDLTLYFLLEINTINIIYNRYSKIILVVLIQKALKYNKDLISGNYVN